MAMGWIGRVWSNKIHFKTALVNISCNCNHAYFCPIGERLFSGHSAVPLGLLTLVQGCRRKTVEAMKFIRWAVRGSLLNMDN